MMPAQLTILMATCNGARYLEEQLGSILNQSFTNWQLIVSDDGSSDGTRSILEDFQRANPDKLIRVVKGPRAGAAANFLSLLDQPSLEGRYVAFSDQDDFWLPHKLERAMEAFSELRVEKPALYGCRTIVTDAAGRKLHVSKVWKKPPSIRNALVQNIVGGHGAVLNPAGFRLLREASRDVCVPYHDWWAYIVMTSCGGEVIVDNEPALLYRQHGANVLGENRSVGARMHRFRLLAGEVPKLNAANFKALEKICHKVSPEAASVIHDYQEACERRGFAAAKAFLRAGVYRQRASETALLFLLAALGRL